MAVNKRLLQGAAAAPGGITPSEHFGVVLYEGDGSSSHSINGGKFGAGAYFGGDSVVDTGLSTTNFVSDLNDRTVDFSFSCWAQIHSYPQGDNTIFYIGNYNVYSPNYAAIILDFRSASKKIRFTHQTQYIESTSTFNAPMTTWVHVAAVRDNSVLRLYINGSQEASVTLTADTQVSSSTTLDIGGFQFGTGTIYSDFIGKIDQVRVFQKALSSSEVSTLYAETAATVESLDPLSEDTTDTLQVLGDSSCIATYRFENNEVDLSGNYDATGYEIQYGAGRYGQALDLNGTSSYAQVGTSDIITGTTFSVSIWVLDEASSGYREFFSQQADNNKGLYIGRHTNTGTIRFNDLQITCSLGSSWNHLVFTVNGSTMKTYQNGSLIDTKTNWAYLTSETARNGSGMRIGRQFGTYGEYWLGKLDQLRLFNKELSASEVTTLYNENSLVASYRFEGNANDDTRNYDGTASNVTYEYGLGFQPDLIWAKDRVATGEWHMLSDSTRGTNSQLFSNVTNAPDTKTTVIQSFDTGGFTVGSDNLVNNNGNDYVAWCFKANGGTTSSNTDGSITSTVQVNETAGFSIVKYTGNNTANATIGHGLSSTPQFIISKNLDNGSAYWATYHHSTGITRKLYLNDNSTGDTVSGGWLDVSSTLITAKQTNANNINENGSDFINYCFTPVDGFSSFGSYEGNGTTEGPIVETGFEPAFILIRDVDGADNWAMVDNKRATTNPRQTWLRANLYNPEFSNTVDSINFYSNGFQVAGGTSVSNFLNESGNTFIYAAFAADPDTEAPTVAKSFSTVAYTGTGATNSIDGLGFEPSFTWIKGRTNTASHQIFDTIRGATKGLNSDANIAEFTNTGMLTSFDSDGFTLGGQSSVNGSGVNYVAWNWKADDNEATIEKVTEDLDAVAVYKFEDNVNDVTSTYNGTATDITYNSSGKFNKSAIFNGTSSKVSVGNWGLTGNPDFSISMWIKGDDWSGDQYVYGQGANAGTFAAMSMFVRNNSTVYHDNRGSANSFTTSLSLSTGTWYHWLHTYSSSNGLHTLYINGASVGTVTESLNIVANNTGGTIGTREIAGSYYFDGEIDQFRVYQQTLTASNAATLYAETAAQNDNLSLGMTYVASIQSIVSANANAGFSIVKYEGTGSNAKVPHGLSAAPEMMIIKNLDQTDNWVVYHSAVGTGQFLSLNSTDAASGSGDIFGTPNDTGVAPTSTVFTVGSNHKSGANGENYIAYCFHSVSGYSKIGSYTGTSSSGNSVNVGFAPDWVLIKGASAGSAWILHDTVRSDGTAHLRPNTSGAEDTGSNEQINFTSTGFSIRNSGATQINTSGDTYIYMAFKIN